MGIVLEIHLVVALLLEVVCHGIVSGSLCVYPGCRSKYVCIWPLTRFVLAMSLQMWRVWLLIVQRLGSDVMRISDYMC